VIAPIGEDGSSIRKKSDRVLKYIIGRALENKYKAERADDIRRPGMVTSQIIEQLLTAPLVVADLSGGNPNVYYELAIRHAIKKPVVHMITKGESAPFDVSPTRHVTFDITDPEVDEAQNQLRDHVAAIETGEEVLTPIQFTQILTAPARGEGEKDSVIVALGRMMAEISDELRGIKQMVQEGRPSEIWWSDAPVSGHLVRQNAADALREAILKSRETK
jgi:hypothetical protein